LETILIISRNFLICVPAISVTHLSSPGVPLNAPEQSGKGFTSFITT